MNLDTAGPDYYPSQKSFLCCQFKANFVQFYTFCQQHTTLHITAGLLLKLSRVGLGQFLDGRPDAAGSGVGWPVGGTLSSGLKKKNIPMPQGSDWGHCPV